MGDYQDVHLQSAQHITHDHDGLLRQFVEGRDTPCPSCGYNLRNTCSQRCSECGARLKLALESTRRRTGRWIIPLILSSAGFGFFATMLAIELYALVQNDQRLTNQFQTRVISRYDLHLMFITGGATAAFAVGIAVTIWLRDRILRGGPIMRWTTGLAWTAALLLAHLWLTKRVLDLI